MRWSSLLREKKKKRKAPPKCPDCRNRKHNKQIKPKIWRCAACYRVFVYDPEARGKEEKELKKPEQIGVDVEDGNDYEEY